MTTETAAEKVLNWIEDYIEEHDLKPGDPLPAELEIAQLVGVGRSSVREALTALKALGIIRTRRKGGITIMRDPVLLRMRSFFAPKYTKTKTKEAAIEFRAMLEWGAAEQVFSQIKAADIRKLRAIVDGIAAAKDQEPDVFEAEQQFHTLLLQACGNRLAGLLSFIITPVFDVDRDVLQEGADHKNIEAWLLPHNDVVTALENKDKGAFLKAMHQHTHVYMRADA